MVGGLKGGKGLARWREVRRAVALQLGDLETSVQQAALRCLKVRVLQAKQTFPLPPKTCRNPSLCHAVALQLGPCEPPVQQAALCCPKVSVSRNLSM